MSINQRRLDEINARRKRLGKPPMSLRQAQTVYKSAPSSTTSSDSSLMDYMVGHSTGIAYNGASLLGSLTRDSDPAPTSGFNAGGGEFAGGGASASDDSGGDSGGSSGGDSGGGSSD